jgi:alkylation response protein AidB-like acyl-CoA dehydrogenase
MTQANTPLTPQATRRLTLDTEPYLSCDDCFDQVDSYVEALLADPNHDQPAMRTHLAGCAACAEEARSLVRFVAQQDGADPAAVLRRLEDDPT